MEDKKYKNPGIAALLSFIIPGAGQIYCERIVRGIVIFLLSGYFGLNGLLQGNFKTLGLVFVIWVFNIFDAHFCARCFNNPEKYPDNYIPKKKVKG